MNCQNVIAQLSAYLDSELDGQAAQAVSAHLESCPRCAGQYHDFEQLRVLTGRGTAHRFQAPSWEAMESRLQAEQLVKGTVQRSGLPIAATARKSLRTNLVAWAMALAVAASFFIAVGLRNSSPSHDSQLPATPSVATASVAAINLQPLMQLFWQDPSQALQAMSEQYASKEVSIEQAETSFGRPIFVKTSVANHALPGNAQLVSTQLFAFPFCKCSTGGCTCGPEGCNCVACVCQRPDGTSYLVIEHCKSQSVSFGDLPVKLVDKGDQQLEQAEVNGQWLVSWEKDGQRLSALGLRSQAEINTLLAHN